MITALNLVNRKEHWVFKRGCLKIFVNGEKKNEKGKEVQERRKSF